MYLLRAMQIYSHNAHHLIKGNSFFGDHEFFGDVYLKLEDDFDSVAERIIGLFGEEPLNLQVMMVEVTKRLANCPSTGVIDIKDFFSYQLKLELSLCDLVRQILMKNVTPGTEQLIGEICNQSEIRQYKLKQRLK